MNFPRNIFQTWKTDTVPDNWKEGQQSVIKMNPGWKYTLLTDADNDRIVKENFPDFYQTFISLKYPIQRADAIRYCVLYLYGGIYLDLDFICNKSFDDLYLNKEVGLTRSITDHKYTNCFMISQPRSQFWLYCIEYMNSNKQLPFYKRLTMHYYVFNTCGPGMLHTIAKKYPNYIQDFKNIQVNCGVCNQNKFYNNCKVDTRYYLTPLPGNSWHTVWDSKIMINLYCNRNIIIIFIIIIILYLFNKKK